MFVEPNVEPNEFWKHCGDLIMSTNNSRCEESIKKIQLSFLQKWVVNPSLLSIIQSSKIRLKMTNIKSTQFEKANYHSENGYDSVIIRHPLYVDIAQQVFWSFSLLIILAKIAHNCSNYGQYKNGNPWNHILWTYISLNQKHFEFE
jgi:hypothetical protein